MLLLAASSCGGFCSNQVVIVFGGGALFMFWSRRFVDVCGPVDLRISLFMLVSGCVVWCQFAIAIGRIMLWVLVWIDWRL